MVPKNRKELVKLLREKFNYSGADDKVSIKKYVEAEVELVDEAGNALDFEALWQISGKVMLKASPEAAPAEEVTEDRLSGQSGTARIVNAKAGTSNGTPSRHDVAKKAYDRKIKTHGVGGGRHQAVYADADQAEAAGALLRLQISKAVPNNADYSLRAHDEAVVSKAFSSFNPNTGAVLIPEQMIPELKWLTEMYGCARKVANVVPMTTDTAYFPRQTAIVAMNHVAQGAAATVQDNGYDKVNLVAKEVFAILRIPYAVLNDSAVNIVDEVSRNLAEAQANREDLDYALGDGTSTYGGNVGLVGSIGGAIPSGAAVAGGATWSAITEDVIATMMGTVANVRPNNLAFMCSRQFYFQVMLKLARNKGGATASEAFGLGGPTGNGSGPDAQWAGYPVYFNQTMARATGLTSTAANTPLFFGDFGAATMLGDRNQLSIRTSEHRYFDSNDFAVSGWARIAINVHGDGRANSNGPISYLTIA